MITLTINGREVKINDNVSLGDYIDSLDLKRGRVVIERNKEIVDREDWERIILKKDDVVEIVEFVGGG